MFLPSFESVWQQVLGTGGEGTHHSVKKATSAENTELLHGPDKPGQRATNRHALCQVRISNSISLGSCLESAIVQTFELRHGLRRQGPQDNKMLKWGSIGPPREPGGIFGDPVACPDSLRPPPASTHHTRQTPPAPPRSSRLPISARPALPT